MVCLLFHKTLISFTPLSLCNSVQLLWSRKYYQLSHSMFILNHRVSVSWCVMMPRAAPLFSPPWNTHHSRIGYNWRLHMYCESQWRKTKKGKKVRIQSILEDRTLENYNKRKKRWTRDLSFCQLMQKYGKMFKLVTSRLVSRSTNIQLLAINIFFSIQLQLLHQERECWERLDTQITKLCSKPLICLQSIHNLYFWSLSSLHCSFPILQVLTDWSGHH